MPASLTWLDHDPAARERSLRLLALFQERDSRDELGLGAIRDSFADQLFPGTSTIQTRLRYMFFIPWIYTEAGSSDLIPFWIFEIENGALIERWVPLLPFSREVQQLERPKRGLALYRLVFGQPRQEDLLVHLPERIPPEQAESLTHTWRISLSPPV